MVEVGGWGVKYEHADTWCGVVGWGEWRAKKANKSSFRVGLHEEWDGMGWMKKNIGSSHHEIRVGSCKRRLGAFKTGGVE